MAQEKVYMDYGASSPIDPKVEEVVMKATEELIGNPSSLHTQGRDAKKALEDARAKVAALIGADQNEIVFTSGGTESNNLGIKGAALRNRTKGQHIITSEIEHMSVLNPCKALEKMGFKTTHLPVDRYGMVDPKKLEEELTDETVLITIQYANGEIGTLEPIKEIGEIARSKGIIFHVDAVAAAGKVPLDVKNDKIDLMSISSNDFYGPKGVGALYIGKDARLVPVTEGGGQERGLRSGSENLPSIIGFGKAAELAQAEMPEESKRLMGFRDKLINGILSAVPKSHLNGHPTKRLPNNVNVRFSYIEGEGIILNLDMLGISASTGSACTSKTLEPSHVLVGTGLAHEEAHGSLQLTLGRWSKGEEVDYVLENLPSIVQRLRDMSPLVPKD